MSCARASCSSALTTGAATGGGAEVGPQDGARPAAAAQATLAICCTFAGSVASTRTANVAAAEPPAASGPSPSVQVLPAAGPGTQPQPAELPPAAKLVCAGTVSVSVTAPASWSPPLLTTSWKASSAPAAAGAPT